MFKRNVSRMRLQVALSLASVLLCAAAANASSVVQLDSDLMIHPSQLTMLFNIGAQQISSSSTWSWPTMSFTQPYKTQWSQVVANGPFNVQFDTSSLSTQDLGFTLTWASPTVSVGTFSIRDTVTENVGGVNVIFNLNGACTNMALTIPNGHWVVQGKLHWDISTQGFVVNWDSFNFQMNGAAIPAINVGQCLGQPGLIQALHDALLGIATNPATLQSVLEQGVLNWVEGALGSLQTQLLTTRSSQLSPGLSVSWIPTDLSVLAGGRVRVAGTTVLSSPGATAGAAHLTRAYAVSDLAAVTSSGFLLPHETIPQAVKYLFANHMLDYVVPSSSIPAVSSFLASPLEEFFVWPDLLNFANPPVLKFDLTSSAAPVLKNGAMLNAGGSAYDLSAPLLVHTLAPANGQYLPYVDFTTPINGELSATVAGGQLMFALNTSNAVDLSAAFRPEFAATRSENTCLWAATMNSSVQSYLNTATYSIPAPKWNVASSLAIQMTDVQVWTESLRLPLNFVSVK